MRLAASVVLVCALVTNDLVAAKIHVSTLPRECFENPLAKGCE